MALINQFKSYFNIFFLFNAIVFSIKKISPVDSSTSWIPFLVVQLISLVRAAIEDFKKYQYDTAYNNSTSFGETLDNKTTLGLEDDVARAHMGNDWRMPTRDEFRELFDYTNNEWISNYKGTGVNGRKFTSKKNGNSIFIPASGYRLGSSFRGQGRGGDVWSSSLNAALPGGALELGFGSGSIYMGDSGRYYGLVVRGVMD